MQLRPNNPAKKFPKEVRKGFIVVGVLLLLFLGVNKIFETVNPPPPTPPRALLITHGPNGIDTIDFSGWDSLKMDSFIRATSTRPTREDDSMYKVYKLDELDSLLNLPNTPSEDSLLMLFEQLQKSARK